MTGSSMISRAAAPPRMASSNTPGNSEGLEIPTSFISRLSALPIATYSSKINSAPRLGLFHSTATREAPGNISLSRARRFPLASVACALIPVTLPSGRARLVTIPRSDGIGDLRKDDGDRRGGLLGNEGGLRRRGNDHFGLKSEKLVHQARKNIGASLGEAPFDRDVVALYPARFGKRLQKRPKVWCRMSPDRALVEDTEAPRFCLLRVKGDRPHRSATCQCDELAPSHANPSLGSTYRTASR